jgi:molybdenum cofactor biosynthesis enzyme MoaA
MFIKSAKAMKKITNESKFKKIINEIETAAEAGSSSTMLFRDQILTPKQIKMLTRKGYNVTKDSNDNYTISWK